MCDSARSRGRNGGRRGATDTAGAGRAGYGACRRKSSADYGWGGYTRGARVRCFGSGRLRPRVEKVVIGLFLCFGDDDGLHSVDRDPVREPVGESMSILFVCKESGDAHRAASSFTRRASSSLYNSATRPEYFFFVSESPSKAEPPCLVKKSCADWFPPTFIMRSWLSCQLSRLVELPSGQLDISSVLYVSNYSPDKGDMHAHVPMHAGAF